jgi:aerobic-type carbon monoxide dehydrogenase small subunit (CoxS/CutS family)
MPQLKITKLVRKIMREHDKKGCYAGYGLFTNLHVNSRTVKCYGTGNVAAQKRMIADIETALVNAEVYDAQCRVIGSGNPWRPAPSIIIELPLE